MRFDLSPLYRSTVGFDRLAALLDQGNVDVEPTAYPPYNIERVSENAYRITMAIAGFSKDDVTIEVKDTSLSVRGEKKAEVPASEREFLHRGIAGRGFERRFQIADHVEVIGAALQDGMLHIDLQRNLPERMKARTIAIGTPAPVTAPSIEGSVSIGK